MHALAPGGGADPQQSPGQLLISVHTEAVHSLSPQALEGARGAPKSPEPRRSSHPCNFWSPCGLRRGASSATLQHKPVRREHTSSCS